MVAIFVAFMFVSLVLTDLGVAEVAGVASGAPRAGRASHRRGHGVRA